MIPTRKRKTFKSSTLLPLQPEVRFHVTHPFSPDRGKAFILIERKVCFGDDRILCFDEDGNYRRFLTSWTDYVPLPPFLAISSGRAYLNVDDITGLSQLLHEIAGEVSSE